MVSGGVALEGLVARGIGLINQDLFFLDDAEGNSRPGQLGADDAADAAVAADDIVISERFDFLLHRHSPEYVLHFVVDQQAGRMGADNADGKQAEENEDDRKETAIVAQRVDLGKSDRGNGDHGHIKGIGNGPVILQGPVTHGSEKHQGNWEQQNLHQYPVCV